MNVTAESGTPPSGVAFTQPKIAVYGGGESSSHLRFTLGKQWGVPFNRLSGSSINSGALRKDGYDVLVVPGVSTNDLTRAKKDIRDWIADGGVYVGTARPGGTGGTPFAVASGFTTSSLSNPAGLGVPGTMFRVALNDQSPVTLGAPDFGYWYGLGEQLMAPSTTGANPGMYPLTEPDFFVSGYASGADVLKGTAALVDEKLGAGRVVLFSGETDYRAYTTGRRSCWPTPSRTRCRQHLQRSTCRPARRHRVWRRPSPAPARKPVRGKPSRSRFRRTRQSSGGV